MANHVQTKLDGFFKRSSPPQPENPSFSNGHFVSASSDAPSSEPSSNERRRTGRASTDGERGRGRGEGGRGRGRGRGGGSSQYSDNRLRLISVAEENSHLHFPTLLASSSSLRTAIGSSINYPKCPTHTGTVREEERKETKFGIVNKDTFDAASDVVFGGKWRGDQVAVLNMANAFNPGGGYLSGATAQEEALCRRSTLFLHLTSPSDFQSQTPPTRPKSCPFYPMHEQGGGIFSGNVRVFRKGDDDGNELMALDERFEVGVISVAAINRPRLTEDEEGLADPEELQTTETKMKSMLRIAKLNSIDFLILGAFGCGAFRNPPTLIATIFRALLTEDPEFTGAFDEVQFAILERSGSSNQAPFRAVWLDLLEK